MLMTHIEMNNAEVMDDSNQGPYHVAEWCLVLVCWKLLQMLDTVILTILWPSSKVLQTHLWRPAQISRPTGERARSFQSVFTRMHKHTFNDTPSCETCKLLTCQQAADIPFWGPVQGDRCAGTWAREAWTFPPGLKGVLQIHTFSFYFHAMLQLLLSHFMLWTSMLQACFQGSVRPAAERAKENWRWCSLHCVGNHAMTVHAVICNLQFANS